MLRAFCQSGGIRRSWGAMGENARMLDSHRRWSRVAAGMDRILEAWLGWSRPPLGYEPIELDPWACWCSWCGAGVSDAAVDPQGAESGCRHCRESPTVFDGVIRLGSWKGRLRELVLGLKYHGWWEAAEPLGRLMALRLRPFMLETTGHVVVVPMPMPYLRRWDRGLDHTRLLAGWVSRSLGCQMRRPLVMKNGRPQAMASRSAREMAPFGRVRLRGNASKIGIQARYRGATIILVDDVRTTGRTAYAAARQLRMLSPARLILAVAAVSDGYSQEGRISV